MMVDLGKPDLQALRANIWRPAPQARRSPKSYQENTVERPLLQNTVYIFEDAASWSGRGHDSVTLAEPATARNFEPLIKMLLIAF